MLSVKQRFHFVVLSIGLLVFYFIFGILQEKIFKTDFGPENERFTFSITFVCLQCVFHSIFAKGMFQRVNQAILSVRFVCAALLLTHEHTSNETPQGFYSVSAVFYVVAIVTSNSALRFISYPCQVVGKG